MMMKKSTSKELLENLQWLLHKDSNVLYMWEAREVIIWMYENYSTEKLKEELKKLKDKKNER